MEYPNSERSMNWDDLKSFLAIAREGQTLAASRRLGIGQATLNRRIGALESALGCRLFDRSATGCRLTDACAGLLIRAERIEAEALQIRESLMPSDAGVSGTIRIGAPDGFGVAYGQASAPAVNVTINARDAESFRQSRTQFASDIARAMSLGRRGM